LPRLTSRASGSRPSGRDPESRIAVAAVRGLFDSKTPYSQEKFASMFNAKITEKMTMGTVSPDNQKAGYRAAGDRISMLKLAALKMIDESKDTSALKQVIAIIPECLTSLNCSGPAASGKEPEKTKNKNEHDDRWVGGGSVSDDIPRFAPAAPHVWEMNARMLITAIGILVGTGCKESVGLLDKVAEIQDSPGNSKACKEWIAKIRNAAADGARKLR
jgi:hypothetical protein